jgi:hypothetical protein
MECFVIMSFRKEFDDIYQAIRNSVAQSVPDGTLNCTRLDDVRYAGQITTDLLDKIQSADLCIADITNFYPNVMWEVGYAAALQKPTILISQNTDNMPFDIKDLRVNKYDINDLTLTLVAPLIEAINQTLDRYVFRIESRGNRPLNLPNGLAIAITGTHRASPPIAQQRIKTLIKPYLNSNTSWYCGANGIVDEIAAEELLKARQKVIVVASASIRVSNKMLNILEKYNAPLINAQEVQLYPMPDAPGRREIFFYSRADLIILVWDKQSQYTLKIVEWLKQQGKDYILGFIQQSV